jgi:hypothetical protein
VPGTVQGAIYGTLRTSTPFLFSVVSGAQWFAIGSTWYAARNAILQRDGLHNFWNSTRGLPLIVRKDLEPSPKDRIFASTVSGTFTGVALGLLFRGPQNVVPGAIMFSLFGYGGQHAYEYFDRRNTETLEKLAKPKTQEEMRLESETWVQRALKSKWMPMTVLTDDEYIEKMTEKKLVLDAEIAIVDERIEEIKKKARETPTTEK